MAKIMDARPGLAWTGVDSHRSHEAEEYGHDAGIPNAPSTKRYEEMVVLCDSSVLQVALETAHRGWMQRHKATFVELRFSNDQTVIRDVREPKIQRLGNAQARDGQQREERRKGPGPNRTGGRQFGSAHQEFLQLIWTENEGAITDSAGHEHPFGGNLVAWIFGARKPSKYPEHPEAVRTLSFGGCLGRPLDRRQGANVSFTPFRSEGREVVKQIFMHSHAETCGSAKIEVGIH
jgi:hypothetical protein